MSIVSTELEAIPSTELLTLVRSRRAAAETAQCWGLHVLSGAVTLVIGATSQGKTTWLHNLANYMARGDTFLGIRPPRPLRVLYVDFESHDGVLEEHLTKIGTHTNLHFVKLTDDPLRGEDFVKALTDLLKAGKYDVVIVDSLMDAYPAESENDNGEATGQMHAFRRIARQTFAAVVLVHNTGQRSQDTHSQDDNPFLGRGATARSDRADVVLNFLKTGDRKRRITVPKSRQSNKGDKIDVTFSGELGYELDSSPKDSASSSRSIALVARIVAVVQSESNVGRKSVSTAMLRQTLGLTNSTGDKQALTRALGRAVKARELRKLRKGLYALPEAPSAHQIPDQPAA
jgi:RecA/RadA recombinase